MTAVVGHIWKLVAVTAITVWDGLNRIMSAVLGVVVAVLLWGVIAFGLVVLTHAFGSPIPVPGVLQVTGTSLLPETSPGGIQVDPHPVGFPLVVMLTAATLLGIGHSRKDLTSGSGHPDPSSQLA